jgi:RecA-family ATPase
MTLAQDITRHFGGEWHGSYGAFPAPGHSAADRGVTVKDADSGQDVLFNTFNGANWREIKDECRRIGLLPERDPDDRQASQPRQTGQYEYTAADGGVLYRTVRIEQAGKRKRFQAQRPDGRGGWVNGMGDVPRVLYRLPAISAAIAKASLKDQAMPTVYLVEGERKADKLTSWGFIATAVAFGCKGWRREYAEMLAGCTVVILPDNDDEGRGFAERAAKDIKACGGKSLIINLPGLPEKGDIIDWTGTASELQGLVDNALNPPPQLLTSLDLAELANVKPRAKQFSIERLAPLAEVTLFTGPGSAGKSLLGQQLATAAAAGLPCLGLSVMTGPAIYLTCEDDAEQLHWRQAHISDGIGAPMASLAGRLHLISLRGELDNALMVDQGQGRLMPSSSYKRLVDTIRVTGSRLVILDNVAHLFTGNENDRGDVTRFVNLLNRLAGETGAAILLLGHPPKPGRPTDAAHDYSGSTAWINAVRSQFKIDHERDENGNILDHDARVLTVGKANYARKGDALRFRWHNWAFLRDEDLPKDQRAEIAAVIKGNMEDDAFLRCLAACTANKRAVSHNPGVNYAPTVFAKMPEGKGLGRNVFERAFERLLHVGKIELDAQLWQDSHRHWKHGIKAAGKCGDPPQEMAENRAATPAATPCGDLRQPPNQPIEIACGDLRAATPLYTTYNTGAASRPGAPDKNSDEGLDNNGDIIGWNED